MSNSKLQSSLQIGTPGTSAATKLLLLGSGELGKEIAIEAQRLGLEVIAIDRYENAPAMQVAHRSYVIDMLNGVELARIVACEQPSYIVPEVEAIATATLVELEREGFNVVPTATATQLTMDREGIRRMAAEDLGLATSPYAFAGSEAECVAAVEHIGTPCIVKPVMSSSGKGQTTVNAQHEARAAWEAAILGGRAAQERVIVEGLVRFDFEITLLTIRHRDGISFCAPIGHLQRDGDYRESWQPQDMHNDTLQACETIAERITGKLGGYGLFGVELFVQGAKVWFSEVSPRPHDTGMVTLISQDRSEFALHLRALLGLPVVDIEQRGPSASYAILGYGTGTDIRYGNVARALQQANTELRLFGKPRLDGKRRLGVALARGETLAHARAKAREVAAAVAIDIQ